MPPPRRDLEKTRRILEEWFRARLPAAREVAVGPLSGPAATGFSSDTLLFDLAYEQDGERVARALVCRAEPAGYGVFPSYDVTRQYRILEALAATGVPVPRLVALERDPARLGSRFFVMERVAGRIPSDNPPYHAGGWLTESSPAERAAVWESGLDALAAIHRCDPAALGIDFLDAPRPGDDTIAWQLAHWDRYVEWVAEGRRFPILEAARAWLLANRPPATTRRELCWGDARIGNMIFDGGRVAAVLDWEMATLGPAEMDLGWFLLLDRHHCEGIGVPRLDGFPARAASIARWEAGSGRRAEHVAFWELFAAYRFAAIMARVAGQMQHFEVLPADSRFAWENPMAALLAKMLDASASDRAERTRPGGSR
ncbi:MAG: phosphotransferase [Proteobacteria bacterium]|nr:MAG: phosphotransferase [Pseudomonadota bacterium]